jgi:hypothetical protein
MFTRLRHRTPPEPDESNPQLPTLISLRSILILFSHLRLGLQSGFCRPCFPTKMNFASLMRATCPAHLTLSNNNWRVTNYEALL